MNKNKIVIGRFSNPKTKQEYLHKNEKDKWIEKQCGGCSFFAPLNSDYGICCYGKSRFYLETVFEHFGCEKYVYEGWGTHSFGDCSIHTDCDEMLALLKECEKVFSYNKTVLSHQAKNSYLQLKYFLDKCENLNKTHFKEYN